jgi:hypothetical protein
MKKRGFRTFLLFAVSLALVFVLSAYAEAASSGLLTQSYTRPLSAMWWQWVLQNPADGNPIFGEGAVDCGLYQSGDIWFLAGTLGGSATRSCTIPQGKFLFFPLVNGFYMNSPGETTTVLQKRKLLADSVDLACRLLSRVDGKATAYYRQTVRVQSAPFPLTLGPGWGTLFGDPALEGLSDPEAVADGYWVLLPPLSPGAHVVRFRGSACDPVTNDPLFSVDVKYNITVQ